MVDQDQWYDHEAIEGSELVNHPWGIDVLETLKRLCFLWGSPDVMRELQLAREEANH